MCRFPAQASRFADLHLTLVSDELCLCRFFLTPKQEAVEWLNSTIDECVVNQKQMLDSKEALEKQVKATEGEMRELLEHSPTLARAIASNTSD